MDINLFNFLEYRISMVFILVFIFLLAERRFSKKITIVVLCITYALSTLLGFIEFYEMSNGDLKGVFTLIQFLLVQLCVILVSDYGDVRAIFLGTTATSYAVFGNVSAEITYYLYSNIAVSLLIECVLHMFFIAIMYMEMREELRIDLSVRSHNWKNLVIMPIWFYLIVYLLTVWPINLFDTPQVFAAISAIFILMVASYSLVTRILKEQRENYLKVLNEDNLTVYADRLKKDADRLVNKEAETAMVRHDMKHYCIMLDDLIKNNENEKALELLKKLNDKIAETKDVRYCENLAVSGIISNYDATAKIENVIFYVDVTVPQELSFDEYEFAAVISNLLDNAMNAAAAVKEPKDRIVKVLTRIIKEQMIVEISNTFDKAIVYSNVTGLPVSERGSGHGYGIANVKAFAQKYGADFDFLTENKMYITRLLINL